MEKHCSNKFSLIINICIIIHTHWEKFITNHIILWVYVINNNIAAIWLIAAVFQNNYYLVRFAPRIIEHFYSAICNSMGSLKLSHSSVFLLLLLLWVRIFYFIFFLKKWYNCPHFVAWPYRLLDGTSCFFIWVVKLLLNLKVHIKCHYRQTLSILVWSFAASSHFLTSFITLSFVYSVRTLSLSYLFRNRFSPAIFTQHTK